MIRVYVDIETTGLNPNTDQITRLTGIKAKGYEVIDIYDCLVNPGMRVDPKILSMTGLQQAVLDLMPLLRDRASGFHAFSQHAMLIGWGSFENTWLPRKGLAAKCFNAIPYAKRKLAGRTVANFKLDTICRLLGVPLRHHDSLSDSLAIYHICNLLGLSFS